MTNENSIDPVKIGKFIKELRIKHDWTQEELANKLYISRKVVAKWETGHGLPSVDLILPLAEVFNISVDELLAGEFNSKLNTIKTVSPYKLNRVFISSIVLIVLLFLFVYWANTFNKIRIYSIYGTNAQLKGNFVVATDRRILNINDIRVVDNSISNTKYYDVEYSVYVNDDLIIEDGNIKDFNPNNLIEAKSLKDYVEDISVYIIDDLPNLGKANKNDYSIKVKYIDENLEEKSYEIDFKMTEFFANNKLFYEKSEL